MFQAVLRPRLISLLPRRVVMADGRPRARALSRGPGRGSARGCQWWHRLVTEFSAFPRVPCFEVTQASAWTLLPRERLPAARGVDSGDEGDSSLPASSHRIECLSKIISPSTSTHSRRRRSWFLPRSWFFVSGFPNRFPIKISKVVIQTADVRASLKEEADYGTISERSG